jgi:hypothetical protein
MMMKTSERFSMHDSFNNAGYGVVERFEVDIGKITDWDALA